MSQFVTNSPRPVGNVIYNSGENITFIAGEAMVEGLTVALSADDTVTILATASTRVPIGVVKVGAVAAGDYVTVDTFFKSIHNGVASGGTLAFGATVKAVGTTATTDELSNYASVSTGFCTAIVINGGAAGETIKVGIFEAPIKLG